EKDALIMRGAELYDHVVNWPNPEQLAVVFAVGAALIMLATLLLSVGGLRLDRRKLRPRWAAVEAEPRQACLRPDGDRRFARRITTPGPAPAPGQRRWSRR
ncbi:MAG: hypothetical protein WA746_22545, partial [Isosphaeraceae bacterium]